MVPPSWYHALRQPAYGHAHGHLARACKTHGGFKAAPNTSCVPPPIHSINFLPAAQDDRVVLSCCHDCPCGAASYATMPQLLNGRDFLNVTVADYFGPEGPPLHCPAAAALLQRSSWMSMQNVFGIMSASAGLVWDATPAGPRTRAATATRVDEGTEAPGVGAPRPPPHPCLHHGHQQLWQPWRHSTEGSHG